MFQRIISCSRRVAVRRVACSLQTRNNCDVVVVGGGAAGLTAAFFAAKQGCQVTVLERTKECGKKILMSGGARCNVLPVEVCVQQDYFTESSKSALKAVFSSWTQRECKLWLEDMKEGVGLRLSVEKQSNKYFPSSNSSRDVRDKLVEACQRVGVNFVYQACVDDLVRNEESNKWVCTYNEGILKVECDSVVLASGGLSFPKVGTDGMGHSILQKLGHSIKPVYPALTPLTGPHPAHHKLQGISLQVGLNCKGIGGKKAHQYSLRHGFLFTHKGFSGPSVLDLSHFATIPMERGQQPQDMWVNFTQEEASVWEDRFESSGRTLLGNKLQQSGLPSRLVAAICEELQIDEKMQLAQLRKKDRINLINTLTQYKLPVTGHEGFKKAEVTGGGVPLNEVNCATMQSRILPGIFLCGEVLDVFGRIGGFNFYWAWLTGRAAGINANANMPQLNQ